jgi:hypothetical protein
MNQPFDPEKAKEAILAEGLPYLDSADAFLKKYGGRHLIQYEERQNGRSQPKRVVSVSLAHFDALKAVKNVDCRWFEHYAERIGKPVTPIGECGQGHASLMIDGNGAVYGGFDECFGKIANSPEEAILELLDRTVQQWESIPELEEKNEPEPRKPD